MSVHSTAFPRTDSPFYTSHSTDEVPTDRTTCPIYNSTDQWAKSIRSYGESWIQPRTSPAYTPLSVFLDVLPTPMPPKKTISPSASTLPSDTYRQQHRTGVNNPVTTPHHLLVGTYNPALQDFKSNIHPPDSTYQPENTHHHSSCPNFGAYDIPQRPQSSVPPFQPFDQYEVPTESEGRDDRRALSHHLSIPNLHSRSSIIQDKPVIVKRSSGMNVRFTSGLHDLGEEEDGADRNDDQDVSRINSVSASMCRLSSKSMPATSLVGQSLVGQRRNVYIPNFDPRCTEDQLCEVASKSGRVISTHLGKADAYNMEQATYGGTGAHRQYAFVMFESPENAADFMAWLREQGIDCEYGKEDFQTQYKALEDPHSSNLYIQGFDARQSDIAIMHVLRRFGEVNSWIRLRDDGKNLKGPLMVRYDSRAQAERVIKELHGTSNSVNEEKFVVRIADSQRQKNLKKDVKVSHLIDHPMTPPMPSRRASVPGSGSSDSDRVDHEGLNALYQKMQEGARAAEQLRALERERNIAGDDGFIPSAWPIPTMPHMPIGMHSPRPSHLLRHTSSSLSTDLQTPRSGRQSVRPPRDAIDSMSTYTPTLNQARSSALQHARSSPELGLAHRNPAKHLW